MILRVVRHSDDYTVIANATLQDPNLSFRATGMLAYLLSKPGDWEPNGRQLAGAKKEGRDAVYSTLAELQEAGYLVRSVERAEDGTWVHVSTVYECLADRPAISPPDTPVLEIRTPNPGNQESVNPESAGQECKEVKKNKESRTSTPEKKNTSLGAAPSETRTSRATALPDAFQVTDLMRQWASEKTPGVDLDAETEQFRDFHRAKGDVAKDWVASWRNWMRKAETWSKSRSPWQKPDRTHRNPDNIYGDESRTGGFRVLQG